MGKEKSVKYESKSFQENLIKLEQIVNMMENQDISLDEAIKLYEEGLKLSTYLNNLLTKYEGKIKILEENFENGKILEENEEQIQKEKNSEDQLFS
ncbi:MAG: exodeoxyribonuclease VII small subunit [Exilispira sp.]